MEVEKCRRGSRFYPLLSSALFQCFPRSQLPLVPYLLPLNTHFPFFVFKILRYSYLPASSSFLSFQVCLIGFPMFTAAGTKQEEVISSSSSSLFLSSAPLSLLPPLPWYPLCCWFDNRLSQVFSVFSESAGCPQGNGPAGEWMAWQENDNYICRQTEKYTSQERG